MRWRWYFLLLIPFIALLAPVYLTATPALWGFPFFYWYQFLWLVLSAGLTWIVYLATREERQ
ncbi:MAG TPA: DUF3311 domain-containing protein [Candidatus Sulfotelmatobacter sp.]|nr:DUF3311 domain-containing protein [Candidatus Sulfotelmatobacter sp.]